MGSGPQKRRPEYCSSVRTEVKVFEGRIEALESLRGYLLKQPQKYVIMTDANIAINFDFNELLDAHIKSGADVTMMYRKQEIPKAFIRQSRDRRGGDEFQHEYLCGRTRVFDPYDR